MTKNNDIGVFDSGVGGLTIWKEIVKILPNENTIYIADSANAPYGEKTKQEIQELSFANTERLISMGAKIIVVACNTATTQSINELRAKYDVPFIGIEPAVKPAALKSKSNFIGVLATNGTLESEHFNKTKNSYSENLNVITQVGEGLVSAIENGKLGTDGLKSILKSHLDSLMKHPIDSLVLGCTHYPLLTPMIRKIISKEIEIIDSGKAVALQTLNVMKESQLLSKNIEKGNHQMFSSGSIEVLKSVLNVLNLPKDISVSYSSLYQSE